MEAADAADAATATVLRPWKFMRTSVVDGSKQRAKTLTYLFAFIISLWQFDMCYGSSTLRTRTT